MASRNYLFSPHANSGYAVCKVVYGSNAFSELASDAMVSLAEYHSGQKVDQDKYAFMKVKAYAEPMTSNNVVSDSLGYGLRTA